MNFGRFIFSFFLVSCLTGLVTCGILLEGCQPNGTPATQPINLVQVEQDFVDGATQALPFIKEVLSTAELAGAFNPVQWAAIQKAETSAAALLAQMQQNVGQPLFTQLQQDFNAVMASLGQFHQAAVAKLQLKAMGYPGK